MKKPQPFEVSAPVQPSEVMRPPFNETNIEAMLVALDAAQLTALLKRVETIRAEKLSDAKRALIAEYRAKATELGLDFDEIFAPAAVKSIRAEKAAGPTAPMPHDWQSRVINYLEDNSGRANANMLHRVVWPDGKAGSGSGGRLRGHLMQLVNQGTLILIRPGKSGSPAIYGLASMIEETREEVAAE